jgi:alkanesulfonate monooxygenase SsuD/methylene tetrahydromethanopterin reductase-like flavin-dependent oxidoreductase (luciferase family)
MRVGVGLWTLQSTQAAPRNLAGLYAALPEDARRVEALGYDSLWMAEHRFWYDGWCPQPLVAIAAAAAATTRLRFGTAMLLMPQHRPDAFARLAVSVATLTAGRLDLGIGLGHRDAEFDGGGLRRDRRGAMMDAGLDALAAVDGCPPIWIGGMAAAALERGARRGTGFVLPQTLYPDEVAAYVDKIAAAARSAGVAPGPVGILKDCWATTSAAEAERVRTAMRRHYREEAGSWWVLKGESTGFQRPELLDAQLRRVDETALIGPPGDIVATLGELRDAGVDLVTLRFWFDVTAGDAAWRSMDALAAAALTDAGALR